MASPDPTVAKMVEDLKEQHNNAFEAIRKESAHSQLRTFNPLTGTYEPCTIHSIDCVIREFMKFLLRMAMRHCAKSRNLSAVQVETIFQHACVAVSVPTIGQDDGNMDNYLVLLSEAGYPDKTCLLSEAQSSAICCLVDDVQKGRRSLDQLRSRNMAIVDMGGISTDISIISTGRDMCEVDQIVGNCTYLHLLERIAAHRRAFQRSTHPPSPTRCFEPHTWISRD